MNVWMNATLVIKKAIFKRETTLQYVKGWLY